MSARQQKILPLPPTAPPYDGDRGVAHAQAH